MKKEYSYRELIELFEKSIERINGFESEPDELISLKPDQKSWSVVEIMEHLVKFNKMYLRFTDRALKKTGSLPTTKRNAFSPRFLAKYFIGFIEPPYKLKIRTLSPMRPENSGLNNHQTVINELKETNQRVIQLITDAEEQKLDLNRIKGKNSVFKFSMTLSEFLLMIDTHQRRHFWQAEQTLQKLSGKSPGSSKK